MTDTQSAERAARHPSAAVPLRPGVKRHSSVPVLGDADLEILTDDGLEIIQRREDLRRTDPANAGVVSSGYLRTRYLGERWLAGVLLVVAAPVMAAVALTIRISSGPGVLYRQERVGRGGSVFTIYKFRTMDPDRRQRTLDVTEDRRTTHKTLDDPRHTRLGSLLRRTSLDELPQLLNVVRGEMSLIGPRPELASVVDDQDLWSHPRHRVKPGITGSWQVSADRHELLHLNLHHDIEYVDTVSLGTDLRILARTVGVFFKGTGS